MAGFAASGLLTRGLDDSLWGRVCSRPGYCRAFSSIPGLHPLHASRTSPPTQQKTKQNNQTWYTSPGFPGQRCLWLRTTGLFRDWGGMETDFKKVITKLSRSALSLMVVSGGMGLLKVKLKCPFLAHCPHPKGLMAPWGLPSWTTPSPPEVLLAAQLCVLGLVTGLFLSSCIQCGI